MHDHKGPQLIQIAPLEPEVHPVRIARPTWPHAWPRSRNQVPGRPRRRLDHGESGRRRRGQRSRFSGRITSATKPSSPKRRWNFCKRMEAEVGINTHNTRMFMTGSGGGAIADQIGAKFVQEVTAVSLAVEKLHPEVYSVIELGGQDAKIIVFKDDEETGRKKKIPSMNDKCAGGTGAVIDKINAKLKIPTELLAEQRYHGIKLHKVAGKCGVFAETDINGLQKVGTPPDELMASLFEAIVLQNLSVLTRGHTLASARAAARRTQQLHSRHARGLAGQHSAHVEGAQGGGSRRLEAAKT